MAEKAIPIKASIEREVKRAYLHDSVPYIANSKTLSIDTVGTAKMFYAETSNVMRIEHKGETIFMPITNIKAMFLK